VGRKASRSLPRNGVSCQYQMKKRDGSVIGDLLSLCITTLASAIIMMVYLSVVQLEETDDMVDQLARKYILEMETIGYLQPSSITTLTHELTAIGASDIELTGTTFSDVGYGNPIYLYISCSIPYSQLNTTGDFFDFFFEDSTYPVTAKRMSTAKN